MILGVALVVDELNKGQRLVFRYPESVPNCLPPNTSTGLFKLYQQYFSISHDNFAKLFRPKNALLNRVLDLTIDDLHFTSYPCPCAPIESSSPGVTSELEPQPSISTIASSQYVISMFNIVIVSVTGKAMKKINPDIPYRCQLRHSGLPGADPIAAALGLRESGCGVCSQSLKRVIEAVSVALFEQEKKSHYLSDQVAIILHLIDVVNKTVKREGGLYQSDLQQLSTAASRDSTEDEQRGARNLNSLLEEQAGLSLASPAPPSSFVVASFDRTTRSASNASALALSEASVAGHRDSTASESQLLQASLTSSGDEALDPSTLPSLSIANNNNNIGIGLPSFLSESAAHVPAPISPCDGASFYRQSSTSHPIGSNEILLPSQDTHRGSNGWSGSHHAGWGIHLLAVTLKNSTLANELKSLYHSLVGGPCVGISFGAAARCVPVSLSCSELKHCDDYRKYCQSPQILKVEQQRNHSSIRLSLSQTSLSQQIHSRPRTSFSAVNGSVWFGSGGVHDAAKRCGINLETDSLLGVSETETIVRMLRSILNCDSCTASSGDEDECSALFGEDNHRLFAFVELMDPTLSFFEMSVTLNEPIEELLSMTTLLTSWGLAEIVSIICLQSCFKVHENAPTDSDSRVANAFESLLHSFQIHLISSSINSNSGSDSQQEGVIPMGGTPPSTSASGIKKSSSSSAIPHAPARVRADSDSNIKAAAGNNSQQTVNKKSTITATPILNSNIAPNVSGKLSVTPSAVVISVGRKEPAINLDKLNLVPDKFSLSSILSLFDGARSLKEVIWLMERPLQRIGSAIVMFLLRRHMLVEVQSFVVNCAKLPTYDLDELRKLWPQQSNNSNNNRGSDFYSSTSSSAMQHWSSFGPDSSKLVAPSGSTSSLDFTAGGLRFSQQESDQLITNTFIQQLNSKELAIYEKLSPYLQSGIICSKVLSELLWSCQVSETEWNRLLPKLPHLKVLRKEKL